MSDYIALTITALVLLDRKNAAIVKGVEVADLCSGMRARSRFEAVCKKGVVHPSPHLNHLKLYQKIAIALASYKRALIHV